MVFVPDGGGGAPFVWILFNLAGNDCKANQSTGLMVLVVVAMMMISSVQRG